MGIERGTIKATVLIETILAAFEMDEILYELREHSAGLNCGRWDYIFSCIKKFRNRRDFCLADRALVTMTTHFMRSYAELCIKTCHRRNIHAMGGMAAQIPVKNDEKANAEAFAKVKADKEREATHRPRRYLGRAPGHGPAGEGSVRSADADAPNQIASKKREDVNVTTADLLHFEPEAPITEKGLRLNVNVAIQYIGAWLVGQGAVPIFNLMEDAATAEISRSQVWQWIRSPKGVLDDGRKVTKGMVALMIPEEMQKIRELLGPAYGEGKYDDAATIFADLVNNDYVRGVPDAAGVREDRLALVVPDARRPDCLRSLQQERIDRFAHAGTRAKAAQFGNHSLSETPNTPHTPPISRLGSIRDPWRIARLVAA